MGNYKVEQIQNLGTSFSEKLGKELVEGMKEDANLKESMKQFMEDNNMSNSGSLYTTVLAKAIYYKSFDNFKPYFDLTISLTPADLGMPEGAGAYKIPKIQGSTAAKLASGEVVEYVNDNKTDVTLETDTYGIGTRINRRLIRRGAKGFIEKLMTAASDAVLRAVATDIINGMVNGAATANTVAGGISWDTIEDAKYNIKEATDSNSILFGFRGSHIAFSNIGWNILAKSTDFKAVVQYGQRNVPGGEVRNDYIIFNGLKVIEADLISVTKAAAVVHAIVVDQPNFTAFLMETNMETFDGRIPGTAGDTEIIHALDSGQVIMNAEAGAVITA